MSRKFLFLASVCVLLVSCKTEISTEEVVKEVAEQYSSYLVNGDCEAYADAFYRGRTLRESERKELADNMKMFFEAQQKERGGIASAEVNRVELNDDGTAADVFLLYTYGDGSREQVLLPMIKADGLWYLK